MRHGLIKCRVRSAETFTKLRVLFHVERSLIHSCRIDCTRRASTMFDGACRAAYSMLRKADGVSVIRIGRMTE